MTFFDRIRGWANRLRQETVALWFAVRDPRTPLAAKVLAGAVLAYALSPIDLIPDFIPILGYLDELLLLPLALWLVIRLVPAEVLAQSRARAVEWLAAGQQTPRSRIGAVIVISVWVVVLWWLIAVFAPSLGEPTGSAIFGEH
ncbi:MAG: YkvA family protein [Burkholderiales bacterium]